MSAVGSAIFGTVTRTAALGPLYALPNGKNKILRADYDAWLAARVVDRRIA